MSVIRPSASRLPRFARPALSAGIFLTGTLVAPAVRAQVFESIDHKGECYGLPTGAGSTKELAAGKAYALEAYGSEYGHHCKADQGRFVFQEMEGDFDVAVRVAELRNDAKTAAKACLMVRERAEDPSARFAAIMAISDLPFARRHDHGFPDSFTFDFRARREGNLENEGFRYGSPELKERRKFPNVWLRLRREGDRVTAFFGPDGVRWTELVPEHTWVNLPSFPLGKRVAVGMCLSSEPEVKPDIRAVARFDRLRGFRAKGPARLPEAQAAAALPEAPLPKLNPKIRPMGLGKALPLRDAKLEDLRGSAPRSLGESLGAKGTLVAVEATACAAPATSPQEIAAIAGAFAKKGIRAVFVRTPGAAHAGTPGAAHAGTPGAAHAGTPGAAHAGTPGATAATAPAAAGRDGGAAPATSGRATPAVPLLHDRDGALAKALGATAGGQVFVFDAAGKLAYSGAPIAVDTRNRRRPFLKEALTAVSAGRPPEVAQSPVPSCPLVR